MKRVFIFYCSFIAAGCVNKPKDVCSHAVDGWVVCDSYYHNIPEGYYGYTVTDGCKVEHVIAPMDKYYSTGDTIGRLTSSEQMHRIMREVDSIIKSQE